MTSLDLAALTSLLGRGLASLEAAGPTWAAGVAELEASAVADAELAAFVGANVEAIRTHGLSALLFEATARPKSDRLRQAAESWLAERGGNAPSWLRYVEGSSLSPHPVPLASFAAHEAGATGLARCADGTIWTWGGKEPGEVRRWDGEHQRVAHARASFLLGAGDASADGWLAVGSPQGASVIGVWDGAGKRIHRLDTGRDFAKPHWLRGSVTRALLIADGELSVFDLEAKKPRRRWSHQRADADGTRPIKHAALHPNESDAVVLEIDEDDVGAARILVVALRDGAVQEAITLEHRFGNDDSGNFDISPDGKLLAFASDLLPTPSVLGVVVIDLESGATVHHLAPRVSVSALRFASQHELWCGGRTGLVLRCDLQKGAVRAFRAASAVVVAVAAAAETVTLALGDGRVANYAKRECIFDLGDLHEPALARAILPFEHEARALVLSMDGVRQVREGDTQAADVAPFPGIGNLFALDSAGQLFAAAKQTTPSGAAKAGTPSEVVVVGLSTPKAGSAEPAPVRRALIPSGSIRRIWVNRATVLVERGSAVDGRRLTVVPLDGTPSSDHEAWGNAFLHDACFCPTTDEFACAVTRKGLVFLDARWAPSHVIASQNDCGAVRAVGGLLLTIFVDGAVRIYELPEHRLRAELRVEPAQPGPDRKPYLAGSLVADRAVAASGVGPALLFSLSTAAPVARLAEHQTVVFARMSQTGSHVLTVDRDATLAIWETTQGQRVVAHGLREIPRDIAWLGEREILLRQPGRELVRLRLEQAAAGGSGRLA